MEIETEYANTDFDLKSEQSFDQLNRELERTCCVLHYTQSDDGHWHSIVESEHDDDCSSQNAEMDILAIIESIKKLSSSAKTELEACYVREFNIGIHCGDTWAYEHTLSSKIVQQVATLNCSIGVTLYPMRNSDGTPRD